LAVEPIPLFCLDLKPAAGGEMTIASSLIEGQAHTPPHGPVAALLLPPTLRLTVEQFALVCEANPEAVLELAADGQLISMTPTGGDTGRRNTRLLTRLQTWADRQGGWEVFDSSTGFRPSVPSWWWNW
jgi:hypothetical protein